MREILHADLLAPLVDGERVGAEKAEGLGSSEVRGRMELEHERALRERTQLAVLRIAVDHLERLAQTVGGGRIELILASATSVLRTLPRNGDLLAVREQDEIVAVLPQTDAAAAESLARALQQNAAPIGMRLSIGLACAQFETPCWFQTLLAVAQEGVEVAFGAGGGRVIHSELYTFHQRRLERLSPDRAKPVLPPETKRGEPEIPANPPRGFAAPAAGPLAPAIAQATIPFVPGLHALEERVLTLAREWTEEALSKALAESHKAHANEVDTMQRRIDKLSRALEDAQGELVRAQAGQEIDPGVASAFRTVQGLRDSNGSSAKRDMLSQLFEANLELRTLLGRQG
jgi:GGDEF domain-containing protein